MDGPKSRDYGRQIPADYMEIHYEELVDDPRSTLAKLSQFLDHDLNYDRIRSTGLGRLRESNSSFREEIKQAPDSPVNRWKQRLSPDDVIALETVVGQSLVEFGYALTSMEGQRRTEFVATALAASYRRFSMPSSGSNTTHLWAGWQISPSLSCRNSPPVRFDLVWQSSGTCLLQNYNRGFVFE